ncbi:MAG: hypothetical protein ACP5IO_05345 [Elusimicrobiales bacterium]
MINLFLFLLSTLNFSLKPSGCVKQHDNLYNISFCGRFEVGSIKKHKQAFSFPYDTWRDKKYRSIFAGTREVYDKILNAIDSCNLVKYTSCYPSFKLIEFVHLKSKSRVANAAVSFEGLNVVFGVVKKNNFYLVFPPSNFVFLDDDYKKSVFRYIIDLWKKEKED